MNLNDNQTAADHTQPPLMGLAALMRRAFANEDLGKIAAELIERAQQNTADINALMDLSTVLELSFKQDIALTVQMQALQAQPLYHLPAKNEPAMRLLALMTPGPLSANAPLEFLLEDSDVALDMLYVGPGLPSITELPDHDLLFVAISESETAHPLLEELQAIIANWPRPVLNPPQRIMHTARDRTYELLNDAPGVVIPPSLRVERQRLERIVRGETAPDTLGTGIDFPIIVRPLDSHAGHGLERIATVEELERYLAQSGESHFFVAPFVDYSGTDGLFRKYRVVLVDGRPFAGHMGVSEHWMIHYLNAGMTENAAKRDEEAQFMAGFDEEFAQRHAAALEAIATRIGLDYLVIDCAETVDGELLIFEVDPGAVVHAIDPPDIFPYKEPAMRKVFAAFRKLLDDTVEGDRGLL